MDDWAVVTLTQELVRIPSTTENEREIALLLESVMRPIFDDVTVDDLGNVVGIMEGTEAGPTVLFNGHTDHVDPGSMRDPYSGALVDASAFGKSGKAVYGRGSCDMKGGVAAMVSAAADLRSTGFRGRLVMMAAVQEEPGGAAGTRHAMERLGFRPDVAVCGEPSRLDICLGHRGKVEFELEVRGRTAHASNPSRGINAVLLMNRFISEWSRLPMPEDPIMGQCTSAITNITCSPGRLSIVPDRCTLVFDVRFLPGEPPDRTDNDVIRLLEEIRSAVPEFNYELRRRRVMPAYWVDPGNPHVQLMSEVVRERRGSSPRVRAWLFGTDGSHLVNDLGIPTIGFGPGDEDVAHTPEEHVLVDDLLAAREVYADFVRRLSA